MPTLRLTQEASGTDRYRVRLRFEEDRRAPIEAAADVQFALSDQDAEKLRWYLEDYLQYPLDPAPKIAAGVERQMDEIGAQLFTSLFEGNKDGVVLWARLSERLADTRIEIASGLAEAATIPWELLRDPRTGYHLATYADTFVRTHAEPVQSAALPEVAPGEPVRVLVVICRPKGAEDVPFRSVAGRLVKGLTAEARQAVDLDVLRPPTFDALAQRLREAKLAGRPYHVVHFDGHGTYVDATGEDGTPRVLWRSFLPILLGAPRSGKHGYLAFENPAVKGNMQLVDGQSLGGLLVETGVPVLVLNACRSAHAEPLQAPEAVPRGDVHEEVRAYGSLAQEVLDKGVAGVLAMRYNVYVVTAARYVADLYAELAKGRSFGRAATLARKALETNPQREIGFAPRPLQDWPVPVVWEAAPIALFPELPERSDLVIQVAAGESASAEGRVDDETPPPPDVGFYGRDETLLALDRAFDRDQVVLLHAYAGSGKTTTAAEFARWYALTGGVEGSVLFTSFERYLPLARVLDKFGAVFGRTLEQAGVHWLALDDEARRDVALQVMQQIPVLWIWDNVEPVAGFPTGSDSVWSTAEQRELVDFLRAARGTKAKFLLTSRRDEQGWLGELPTRVQIPEMPFQERVQLARALAEKRGRRLEEVEDWRPLLDFTQGNPLTVTVLVGQALREGMRTSEQIQAFVARLRTGEAAFEDEQGEGRSRSLGASLGYGFETAFSEEERKVLAVLHLFQGFVDVDALRMMGNPKSELCLAELRDLDRERGIALLDRAAEIGLLTGHGGGYYSIHPALPWYFRGLFVRFYGEGEAAERVLRAYVEAVGRLGDFYLRQYDSGRREVISALRAEEANLLHARELARRHGWWGRVISTMQGPRVLYDQTGRRAEWARLVEEIVPDFVDAESRGPLPGRQEQWSLVMDYRVGLAMERLDWAEAERLQRLTVEWSRRRAAPALEVPPEELDGERSNAIRSLAMSEGTLGQILYELKKVECVSNFDDAARLLRLIGDRPGEAVAAFNLGHAYLDLPGVRDLAESERWYQRSLEFTNATDRLGRGQCLGQLGQVAYERFLEVREAGRPEAEFLAYLNASLGSYQEALELFPPDAVNDMAVAHHQLGLIYGQTGDLAQAVAHYSESARYEEAQGNHFGAAQTRFNVALAFFQHGRLADAREYALAALRGYEPYGAGAAAQIEKTRRLLADIEAAM